MEPLEQTYNQTDADKFIDHSFIFGIREYNIPFSNEFEKYITNFMVTPYEFNHNSYFDNTNKEELKSKTDVFLEPVWKSVGLKLSNIWVQKYNVNEFHDLHTHGSDMMSFVWYIDCTENSSKTMFYNPGYPYFKTHELEVKPKKGKLILFHGIIPHVVYPNKDTKRIIISGNLYKD